MNRSFSFHRLVLLLKQHWAENRKRYLLSVLAFAGLLTMWFILMLIEESSEPLSGQIQRNTYFFLLFAGGSFYASQFFRELGNKIRANNFLLLPASILEKFLCSLFYTVIVFFLTYTAVFYLVDLAIVAIANAIHSAYVTGAKAEVVNVFSTDHALARIEYVFAFFFSIQATYLLGSVYFEKYSFVKTVISLFILVLALLFLGTSLTQNLLPDGGFHDGFTSYRVSKPGEEDKLIALPDLIGKVLSWLVLLGTPLFLWLVTYIRLKEKEV